MYLARFWGQGKGRDIDPPPGGVPVVWQAWLSLSVKVFFNQPCFHKLKSYTTVVTLQLPDQSTVE